MKFFNSKKAGFTLIELLVVISIIGLLSSVVLAALGNARARGRDASRVQAIGQVRNALELYFSDFKAYPSGTTYTTIGSLVATGGPLIPYIKGTPPNFAITGGTAPAYYSDTNSYELLVPTESTGFAKNISCNATDYAGFAGGSSYCYGNNPSTQLSTTPVNTGSVVFTVRRGGSMIPGSIASCSMPVSFEGAPTSIVNCALTSLPVGSYSYLSGGTVNVAGTDYTINSVSSFTIGGGTAFVPIYVN